MGSYACLEVIKAVRSKLFGVEEIRWPLAFGDVRALHAHRLHHPRLRRCPLQILQQQPPGDFANIQSFSRPQARRQLLAAQPLGQGQIHHYFLATHPLATSAWHTGKIPAPAGGFVTVPASAAGKAKAILRSLASPQRMPGEGLLPLLMPRPKSLRTSTYTVP